MRCHYVPGDRARCENPLARKSFPLNLGAVCADTTLLGILRAWPRKDQRRRAIIFRSGGVVRLEGRFRTKRPRLAGCKGGVAERRACSYSHLGGRGSPRKSLICGGRAPCKMVKLYFSSYSACATLHT